MAAVASAPRLLAGAGVDAERLARDCGLAAERFDNPGTTIGYAELGRYLVECERATGDDSFALRVGSSAGPGALHAIGYLARHSPDVRTALATLRTHLHHSGGTAGVSEERGVATIDYRFLYPRIGGAQLISEGGVGMVISMLRQWCGAAWSPLEVHIARRSSSQPAKWRRATESPVYFGADGNKVVFAAKWLDHPVEGADPHLHRILNEQVAQFETDPGTDFPLRVCAAIRACLLDGDTSAAQIARRVALGPRTLRRRLSAHDTSLAALLEQTRSELACQLLQDPGMSMAQISDMLGFAHSSAFSRAFRGWNGLSPREWRARQAPSD